MSDHMKIYLADDHQIVRDGLKLMLQTAFDQAQFFEFGTFGDLLKGVQHDCDQDLILCDLHMPDRDGLTGIKQIRKAFPNMLLIVLSGHFGKPDVDEALAIGVNGFVGKTSRGASLVNIIHLVQAGETYLPSEMARAHSFNRSQPSVPSLANPLTQREIEVLSHLASAYSNKLIARQLNVEESTIKTHVKSLYRKLAVSNRIEAAKMAMKLQLPEVAIG